MGKDAKQVEAEIKKELKRITRMAKNRLAQPTSTWKHPVLFKETEPHFQGNDLVSKVTTEDAPYFYLDKGTEVRYATMKQPFSPKTKPGSFQASAGVGGKVAYVTKAIPRPGIEARKWTELTAEEHGIILQIALDNILAKYKGRPASSVRSIHGVIDEEKGT